MLLGFIYYRQHQYQDAVRIFGRIRPKLDEHYYLMPGKDREIFESLYYPVLLINGIAHYYLENWADAIRDLEVYTEKYPSPTFCDVIAICCYRTRQYSKSLKYFKHAYQLHGNVGLRKDTSAYNAGVLNAVLGNTEKTIYWLKIPLGHDRKLWLEKIKNNEDFDAVRNDKKFAEFLKQQENTRTTPQLTP